MGLERSDMGAYGGEENCGWTTEIDLSFYPDEPVNVTREDTLEFNAHVHNDTQNDFTGDCWFTLRMPDSSEVLAPEEQLNYPNPLPVVIPPLLTFDLAGLLNITGEQDTGLYQLIGRVGSYPDSIVDEGSIAFRVYQPGIIHVPGDSPAIQGAIDVSLDGDTVLGADGIYTGDWEPGYRL